MISLVDVAAFVSASASVGALGTSVYIASRQNHWGREMEQARWIKEQLAEDIFWVLDEVSLVQTLGAMFDYKSHLVETQEVTRRLSRVAFRAPPRLAESALELREAYSMYRIHLAHQNKRGETDFKPLLEILDKFKDRARKDLGLN